MSEPICIHGIPLEHTIFSFRSAAQNELGYNMTYYSNNVQIVLRHAFEYKKIRARIRHKVQTGAFAGSTVVHEIDLVTMMIYSRSEHDPKGMMLVVEDIRIKQSCENIQEYAMYLRRKNHRLRHVQRVLERKNQALQEEWESAKDYIHEMYKSASKRMTQLHRIDFTHLPGSDNNSSEYDSDASDGSLYGR